MSPEDHPTIDEAEFSLNAAELAIEIKLIY